ncbi:hypothetical protein D3C80_1671450 [compost metagenome]
MAHHDARTANGAAEQLKIDHRDVGRSAAGTAVFLRKVRQDHAHLAHCPPGFSADVMLLAPLLFLRCQLLSDKTPDAVGELPDFLSDPGRCVVSDHVKALQFK